MGFIDKFKHKIASSDSYNDSFDDSYYDDLNTYEEVAEEPQQQPEQPSYTNSYNSTSTTMGNVINGGYSSSMGNGVSINGSAIELKVVRPDKFDCVSGIADHLLNKRTVVLNLEATNKETARRLIDFLSGVAYSINGQLKRVANNAYVITPENVEISGDQQNRQKQQQQQQQQQQYQSEERSEDYYG